MQFEKFLVEQCAVPVRQVEQANALRRRSQPPLGALAREKALLTHAQVDRVLRQQRSMQMRFGQTAVELGLLSDKSVTSLLQTQRERTPTVSEILVDMGVVDGNIYEWVLEWFQQTYGAEQP